MKSPYSFPARSRKAMIAAIESIMNRRFYDGRSWSFCWNVKLHFNLPYTAADLNPDHYEGGTFNPAWDTPWLAEMGREWFFTNLIDDMRRPFIDGEYTVYPGVDAERLEFEFNGRSGGWLILTKAYGHDLSNLDSDDLTDSDEWPTDDIRNLYRALVCLDTDITPIKVGKEAAFQIAFQRMQWEETRQEEEDARNAAIAEEYYAARPDLAPAYAD